MRQPETLRETLDGLDENGLLRRVTREIDKDNELMPLVKCQFRGLPESERTGWLFENVTDANGNEYDMPVAISVLGPSREGVRVNMGVESEDALRDLWREALENPIDPEPVADGPVQDVVIEGEDLQPGNGVDAFPVSISSPGFDPAPFFTSGIVVTEEPETGNLNAGVRRCHLKSHDRFGVMWPPTQDIATHWQQAKQRGEKLDAAVVIGAPPHIGIVSVSKIPYSMSEYTMSGGLLGDPVETVQCRTVDLQVPAHAEIVIEGQITNETFVEGPFGEFTGYMGGSTRSPNFEVSAITHRSEPVFQEFIEGLPPTESDVIRRVGYETVMLDYMRKANLPGVKDVALHDSGASLYSLVVQMDKTANEEAYQAMQAATSYHSGLGKFTIAVDEDIDIHDLESVMWALCFRVMPHRDIQILKGRKGPLDPSSVSNRRGTPIDPDEMPFDPEHISDSAILIDATRSWDYPPTSLPSQGHMEDARAIWNELDLPDLDLVDPWYGQSFGDWPEPMREMAEAATEGRYFDRYEEYAAELKQLEDAGSSIL